MPRALWLRVVIAVALLAVAACSRQVDPPPEPVMAVRVATSPPPTVETETPKPRSVPSERVNLAAADMGGAVEEITGSFGPGFTGRRLVDGPDAPTWRV